MNSRTFVLAFGLSAAVFAALPAVHSSAQESDRSNLLAVERRTIEIFERVSPSVVQVVGRKSSGDVFSTDENSENLQSGTGFIWDAMGHVVTNNHVVQGTNELAVRLASGEAVRAQVVGVAPTYDLAVLRLVNPRQLPPPISSGTSSTLKVGQYTLAIGTPYGLTQSLTTGVISALQRRLPTRFGREIANVIQTDAAINPGNSGGPLLDSGGRLIGVNTAIFSPSGANAGVGFAIPVDIVNRVVPDLIRDGRVPTPGIGLVPAAEAVATRLGVEGIVVMRIVPNSPAARAGVKGVNADAGTIGDVIVKVGGKKVHRIPDLTDELERVGVGGTIQLTLKRDDKEYSLDIAVVDVARPAAQRANQNSQ